MTKLIKIVKWGLLTLGVILIAGYNVFVQWQYSKLPENLAPSSRKFSNRVQRIYWRTEIGNGPMEMNPYPFWKVLLLAPRLFQNHGKLPPDFFAASLAARSLIASRSPPQRSLARAVTELFGAIWISKHWSAEETANTLLGNANFCHGFSGMEAAARGYYGFPVDELTNEEVAFLSGISRGACGYSPWWNRQRAGQRAARVLSALSQDKALEVGTDTNACFNRLKPPPKQARTTIR